MAGVLERIGWPQKKPVVALRPLLRVDPPNLGALGRQGDPGRDLQGQDLGCGGDDTESIRRTMLREK